MSDLLVGVGLVLVFEGVLWAAFPGMALQLLATAAATPEPALRRIGILALGLGLLIVWLVRG